MGQNNSGKMYTHALGAGGLFGFSAAPVRKDEEVLSTAIKICQFLA